MKLKIIWGSGFEGPDQLARPLSAAEMASVTTVQNISARVSLYGFPIIFGFWLWLSLPVGLFGTESPSVAMLMVGAAALLTPLFHELLHLFANPPDIWHSGTIVFIRLAGVHSDVSVRGGSPATREKAIWIAACPFLFLTVIPFAVQIIHPSLNAAFGLMAALNFSLSTFDLVLALSWYITLRPGQLHRPENK
jgi:hypothetical protein